MPGKSTIFIIEDEEAISMAIQDELEFEGFQASVFDDGESGLDAVFKQNPDLIILDLMLPKKSGFEICREVRRKDLGIPIIILTARAEEIDRVRGLDLGADDYVIKPFSLAELVARVRAVLRRSAIPAENPSRKEYLELRELRVDSRKHQLHKNGVEIELTHKEFQLLEMLLKYPGEVISRDRFLDELWGEEIYVTHRTVDTHMASLRKKIEADPHQPQYIISVRGAGYKMSEEPG
jgi:DNA-binding response OmpR family regulator